MADSRFTPNPRKYAKSNFFEILELITPEVYKTEDRTLSGTETNPLSDIINGHINAADNISQVLSLSGVANTQTSSLGNISGISQYFVKQNKLTNINPFTFESKILLPLNTTLANYDTSAEFNSYLSGTLLPMMIPASTSKPAGNIDTNITALSSLTNSVEPSSVHNYLTDALGWFYFLNTSGDGDLDYSPSSFVLSSLNTLYLGNTLETVDGVKGFSEYVWRNYGTCSLFSGLNLIPSEYVSGTADAVTEPSAGVIPTYTSGIQRLDKYKTLVDVAYSPLYLDEQDTKVKDAFQGYIDASLLLSDAVSKGPLQKFNTMLGYQMADVTDQIEEIGLIYDIENANDDQLTYIADLIGFKLRGGSASKWRQQLRMAIDLYKKSGTIDAIQTSINALIIDSVLDLSGKVEDLWESYIPHLIWYALGTESPLFRDLTTWTHQLAQESCVQHYSPSSLEENLKIVTDDILLSLYKAFPKNFIFHGERWNTPRMLIIDENGDTDEVYTIIGDPDMLPFHMHPRGEGYFSELEYNAYVNNEEGRFDAAECFGPLGSGVYMAGESHPLDGRPVYLSATGDMEAVYSYRLKHNFPIPPFEEVKYYRDCTVTADLVELLVEKLKCFQVRPEFADEVGDHILSGAVTSDTDLGSLNEFLMLFSSVQTPPNFDRVMLSISDYEKNLLGLWNGKSSHIFVNFVDSDFDFSKTTMEGDGKWALYEAARVSREYSPAHAIMRVNLTGSANDYWDASNTSFDFYALDQDNTRASYTSASILGNFESSGTTMGFALGGGDSNLDSSGGRDGSNTFKRSAADNMGLLISGVPAVIDEPSVARRALRRRNFRYVLPNEGYYDRTGFNGPINYDASTLEGSMASSLRYAYVGLRCVCGEVPSLKNQFTFFTENGTVKDGDPQAPRPMIGSVGGWSAESTENPDRPGNNYYSGWWRISVSFDATDGFDSGASDGDIIVPYLQISDKSADAGVNLAGKCCLFALPQVDIMPTASKWAGASTATRPVAGMFPEAYSDGYPLAANAAPTPSATLGYVASAGMFHPVADPLCVTGVWHECEGIESSRSFSGVATASTFAFRGVSSLGSNVKMPEEDDAVPRYVDRGQLPLIYMPMHDYFESKAKADAVTEIENNPAVYDYNDYWKDNVQSVANASIENGAYINSYEDYLNFGFGRGIQETYRDFQKYFPDQPLGARQLLETGGNIFAQIAGSGLFNCNFSVDGSGAAGVVASSFATASSINAANVWSQEATDAYYGTYAASTAGEAVVPISGTFVQGNPGNVNWRNPYLLSGIEFTDISGSPARNEFRVFRLAQSQAKLVSDNRLIGNTVIKCKSLGGLPRLRFDLSSYGPRPNRLIKDHKFNLKISALVADEHDHMLGGGEMGVWIHTKPTAGIIWSWVNGRWINTQESDLSIDAVKYQLSNRYTFASKNPLQEKDCCLIATSGSDVSEINDLSLDNIRGSYLKPII
jgi:hypothetical protein